MLFNRWFIYVGYYMAFINNLNFTYLRAVQKKAMRRKSYTFHAHGEQPYIWGNDKKSQTQFFIINL